MFAISLFYRGSWRHAESVENELEAHRVARQYRDEHGVPTRVVRMGETYEKVWRPAGRRDRDSSVLAVSPTKGGGDPCRCHVLLHGDLHRAVP